MPYFQFRKKKKSLIWAILDLLTCFFSTKWWGVFVILAFSFLFSCIPLLVINWTHLPIPTLSALYGFPEWFPSVWMVCEMGKKGLIINATPPFSPLSSIFTNTHSPDVVSRSPVLHPETVSSVFYHIHDFTLHVLKFCRKEETNCLPYCLTFIFVCFFHSLAELWMPL